MEYPKYIIFDSNGLEIPVIFSPLISHEEIKYGFNKPISAGFCSFSAFEGKVFCFGKSVSLKLNSRPEDSEILTKHFFSE